MPGAAPQNVGMHDGTRFEPPVSGKRLVQRRGLLQALQRAEPRRLTIVTAPAGYGKTSVGAQWYEMLRGQGYLLSWVPLDPEHSEQSQFILAMLDALAPLTKEGRSGLDASSMPASSLLAILGTRLRKFQLPVVLFLDDYHFAQTDATETVVARLLADRDLDHVKLVLMSRCPPRFPISALRASGELRQIGVGDLGFSDEEAREFFDGSAASLSPNQVGAFNRRTEGWAVALQMVRLLVDDKGDSDAILASFDAGNADMGAYLSEQVFANLPEVTQHFLVQTACFPAVNRELVAAVFADEEVAEQFGRLPGHALPTTVLAGPGDWIRYHPVFHAFLKEEAARRGVHGDALLRRASLWFERCGDCEQAMRHALLCGDADLAARIVESAGGWRRVYSTTRGRAGMFQAILERAAELDLSRFPLTTLGLAVVSAKAAQLDLADHYLSIAERHVEDRKDNALGGDLRVVRVLVALYTDRWVNSADLTALEHDLLEAKDMEIITRALTLNMLAYNFLTRSELDRAIHYGRLAIHAFRSGGADFGAMHLYTHTGQAAFFSGDFIAAAEAYDRLIEEAQANIGKASDLDAVGQVLKAELMSVRGDLDGAAAMLSWALPHLERHDTWFDLLAAGFTTQQRIHRTVGDVVAAHAAVDRARTTAHRRGFDRLTRVIDGERAALLLAHGDVEPALRYASANGFGEQAIDADRPNNLATHLRGTTPALLWTRIYLALGERAKARTAFDQLRIRQSQRPHMLRSIELALLEIRLMLAEGDLSRAAVRLSDLMLATPVADHPTLVRIEGEAFCNDLRALAVSACLPAVIQQRLSAVLGSKPAGEGARRIDVDPRHAAWLTGRERRVVELLCTGLSNKEIGRRLALSDNTVKFHLRNIYTKLNVSTRTAAVMAARDVGALPG